MRSYATDGPSSPAQSKCGEKFVWDTQESNKDGEKEILRLVPVRDYKDRAILHSLQCHARSENVGFVWFDEQKDRAKLAWIRRGRNGEAVGYCIFKEERYEYSAYARSDVYVSRFISQIFVKEEQRRRLIASIMVNDFASDGGTCLIWVESPKRETVALLQNLGYHESRDRYQLWEMMFGLSCWARDSHIQRSILPIKQELVSATYHKPWLWSGDDAIEMIAPR
jgi:hypothetical protein